MKERKLSRTLITVVAIGMMCLSSGCNKVNTAPENTANRIEETSETKEREVQVKAAGEEGTEAVKDTAFILEYPSHMQAEGFTEPLILDEYPENIVTLSTYPVLTLLEMGVKLAAVPATKVIEYPPNYDAIILPGMMSEQFDIEQVVALEPDLVIVPSSVRETYEPMFAAAEIPVYYVAMTSTTTDVYSLIKEQTQVFVDAFSVEEESAANGKAVMERFDGVEERFVEIAELVDGKKVLAITVAGEKAIYLNKETSTLGCMLDLCGFENVCSTEEPATTGHSMNQLDLEIALEYTPDVIFITGSGTLEENKALMEKIYASNPEYWDSMEAFKEGDVFYLPSSYVSTAGINIITNMENLMNMIEEKYNRR